MQAEQRGSFLSALFVDYDNVYLSLKRRSEEAAARFAQAPANWLQALVSDRLVRRNTEAHGLRRRLVVNRVYGNPVPRRSGRDGPNDPNSFIFVRHHFIRAGFEVIDCPPLTAQLKNGSDIRMAIDVRDMIEHRTRFDEFILLSGDADFTPVLHRLREYDRQVVIYSNDHTAQPYTALCDGRIEEKDFVEFLLSDALPEPEWQDRGKLGGDDRHAEAARAVGQAVHQALGHDPSGRIPAMSERGEVQPARAASGQAEEPTIRALMDDFREIGAEILDLVVQAVREAEKPVPIAYLANRAMKELGHAKTVGTNWAGCGGFLNFLSRNLPDHLRLTEAPPHSVYDPARHQVEGAAAEDEQRQSGLQRTSAPAQQNGSSNRLSDLQNSITRIYEASKAPPLPPSEYQLLFNLIAAEVSERGFQPGRTVDAVLARAEENGVRFAQQDVAFVVGAVDDMDPWLEHSRTPAAIARAYRDVILSRCQKAGLELSDDEHQLIQVWFGAAQWGGAASQSTESPGRPSRSASSRPDIPLPPDFDEAQGGAPGRELGGYNRSLKRHG
ncbi:NYN domain-containing protein [Dichotomicrobium thermohalophilum]|uniref:NYN domain-containing protein n=1 Tax=Dichotomicrobium thermohalophilum TaxID=933063 RepID=A0A397QC13_9HYPH|nr:NYN domain-containing protein [Dichotomicrobium thermohalophilum]RIA55781.1 NYN domain-containing protein [Dichotomicrobium thermohalophilum]